MTPEQSERLKQYRARTEAGGGLTMHQWDDFGRLERQYDPVAYEARMEAGRRRDRMKKARELSIEDLQAILAERMAALSTRQEAE